MFGRVLWGGYKFTIFDYDYDGWSESGGIYIITKITGDHVWNPIYIGETDSFWNRIPVHEKWPDFERHGVTHIHTRSEPNKAKRKRIEYELILKYQPPVNKNMKF